MFFATEVSFFSVWTLVIFSKLTEVKAENESEIYKNITVFIAILNGDGGNDWVRG